MRDQDPAKKSEYKLGLKSIYIYHRILTLIPYPRKDYILIWNEKCSIYSVSHHRVTYLHNPFTDLVMRLKNLQHVFFNAKIIHRFCPVTVLFMYEMLLEFIFLTKMNIYISIE